MIVIVKYKPEWVKQALKEGKKPFFVQIPIKTYHKQDITTILGLGTAVERSRTGHRMSQKFVDKLKETSVGKHLFINHDPDQIAGKITGVKEGQPDEVLPIAELLKPHDNPIVDAPRAKVEHWLKNNVQLGLSFGGMASDMEITKEDDGSFTYDVDDGELMEWSVTPINAVKRSDGSVKDCPGGVCQQIATQIEKGPNLPEVELMNNTIKQDSSHLKQSSGVILNITAVENAVELISNGDIDFDTPWNRSSYEWDGTPEEQKMYCLGTDPTSRAYDGNYQYRIGMDGMIYKQAVIAVLDNAPAGSDIYKATDELLESIYAYEAPDDSGNVIEENLNGDKMEDAQFNELKQMLGGINQKVESQETRLKGIEDAKAEELRQAEELKIKQEKEAEQKEMIGLISEAAGEVIQETLGSMFQSMAQNRQGLIQGSEVAPVDDQGNQIKEDVTDKTADYRDPVKYPSVIFGQAVQGKTPAELFGA